jgi:hypothetical protein
MQGRPARLKPLTRVFACALAAPKVGRRSLQVSKDPPRSAGMEDCTAAVGYLGSGPGRAVKRCVKSESTAKASRIPSFSMTTKLTQSTKL